MLAGLLRAAGPAEPGIARLTALKLPAAAAAEAARLAEVVKLVRAADEDLPLTLDPVEYRGLEYQTGVSFSVFGLKGREELARGGRFHAVHGCGLVGVRHGARAAETLPAARNAVERGRPLADQRLCRGTRR